jgi:cysteine sulfinate desulfinase/cysteine desulfurase-like protein
MGRSHDAALQCIRLSFGRFTTTAQIDEAIEALAASAALLREEPVAVTS